MKALVFFLVALALGTAYPIGPSTIFGPTRDDRIRSAIDRNVQWLLSGIRNGSFVGPDLPRAVVALFLAKPGFFSPGHETGQELRDKIDTALTELIRQREIQVEDGLPFINTGLGLSAPDFIPSVELALYVQALLVSCVNPSDFHGQHDLTYNLYRSVIRHHCGEQGRYEVVCTFPSPAMLALCNARAVPKISLDMFHRAATWAYLGVSVSTRLTDEEAFLTMTFGCLDSSNYSYPRDIANAIRLRNPLPSSGYFHYPSGLTVEDFQKTMKDDPMLENATSSLAAIAADMQNLMYNQHVRVSDLPSGVDYLLKSQDEDGSWGQSTLNSFFVLPILSNKNFIDITSDHCSEGSENETLVAKGGARIYMKKTSSSRYLRSPANSLYDALIRRVDPNHKTIYRNGTDGKPYLTSLLDEENNPETGYFWFTYEQTKWPKESFTLLTQSHADIQLKRSNTYILWYRRKTEEEIQNDQNEIEAGLQMES